MENVVRIKDYNIRKRFAQSLPAEEIVYRIMSIPNQKYRVIIALAYLTSSRISEICCLKKEDLNSIKLFGKEAYVAQIKVSKRGDEHIKSMPILPSEPEFTLLYAEVRNWLQKYDYLTQDNYLFGDPIIYEYVRKLRMKDGTTKKITAIDNLLRKRVTKYLQERCDINPHLFRGARLSFFVHKRKIKNPILIQYAAGWKDERMRAATRYIREPTAEEMAEAMMPQRRQETLAKFLKQEIKQAVIEALAH